MKRLETVFLCFMAITVVFLGTNLWRSVRDNVSEVKVHELDNFSVFDHKLTDFIEAGVRLEGEGKDVIFSDSQILYMRAEQWQWYPDLEVQSGRDYILHIASRDIQHSFHLETAATGHKIDVLIQPHKEYQILLKGLKPGAYSIGCTQYCGLEHNKMRGRLIVRK